MYKCTSCSFCKLQATVNDYKVATIWKVGDKTYQASAILVPTVTAVDYSLLF